MMPWRLWNGGGSSVESGGGNGAAILGGTIGAADTPRNAQVRGTSEQSDVTTCVDTDSR